MPLRESTAHDRRKLPVRALLLAALLSLPAQTGCINVMAIAGKVLFGDPVVPSTFQQRTGVTLEEGHTVGLVCQAPGSLMNEFDALHLDVQEEVIRRMRVRGLDVVDSDVLIDAMDAAGGNFNEQTIAEAVPEVDFLLHIELARFTVYEESSPNLYRGRALGTVAGYEVRRSEEAGPVHTIPVFQQDFNIEYPSSHPVTVDQMSESSFVRRCTDEISDVIGRMFYGVPTSELY